MMPQEIRVVQCFQCHMFQVDMVKKTNKWQCKVCNAKQSLRKEIFRGSGADCTIKVQKLNMERGERLAAESNAISNFMEEKEECDLNSNTPLSEVKEPNLFNESTTKRNKWEKFLDENAKRLDIDLRESNTSSNLHKTNKRSKWSDFV